MENQDVLRKLENQQTYMREIEALHAQGEKGVAEVLAQISAIKKSNGHFPEAPKVAAVEMVIPPDDVNLYAGNSNGSMLAEEVQQAKNKYKLVGIGTLLCFVLGSVLNNVLAISWIFSVAGIVGIFLTCKMWAKHKSLAKSYERWTDDFGEKRKPFDKAVGIFKLSLREYEQEVEEGLCAYRNYLNKYKDNYLRYQELTEAHAESSMNIIEQINQKEAELEEIAVIPSEYYHLVSDVLTNLKSGRADSYKEALNLAIEEDKAKVSERQRQEEESRRTAIIERQALEESLHNREMERQQMAHNREMQRAEQERIKIEKDRAEAERRNADRMQREMEQARRDQVRAARQSQPSNYDRHMAMLRCNKCSKRNACTVKGNPNCGAFNPM